MFAGNTAQRNVCIPVICQFLNLLVKSNIPKINSKAPINSAKNFLNGINPGMIFANLSDDKKWAVPAMEKTAPINILIIIQHSYIFSLQVYYCGTVITIIPNGLM